MPQQTFVTASSNNSQTCTTTSRHQIYHRCLVPPRHPLLLILSVAYRIITAYTACVCQQPFISRNEGLVALCEPNCLTSSASHSAPAHHGFAEEGHAEGDTLEPPAPSGPMTDCVKPQVIILGDSGVGKTSLMNQYVSTSGADDEAAACPLYKTAADMNMPPRR